MARSKKTTTSRFGRDAAIPPYTERKRQFYEFTTAKRPVRIGGETKMMSNTELVNLKQLEAALAGNSIAQRDHQRQAEESVLAREHYVRTQYEKWTAYKEMTQQAIDRARAPNEPPPQELPHPADVLVDWAEGVTIAGPTDEASLKRWQGLVHFRDALFVQQIMEDADNRVPMEERLTTGADRIRSPLLRRHRQALGEADREDGGADGVNVGRSASGPGQFLLRDRPDPTKPALWRGVPRWTKGRRETGVDGGSSPPPRHASLGWSRPSAIRSGQPWRTVGARPHFPGFRLTDRGNQALWDAKRE